MRDLYDNELKRDFEKLVLDLGRDVTENNVIPLVRSEFRNVRETQERFIREAQDEIIRFSRDLNNGLSVLLSDTTSEMAKYKDTLEELNRINIDFVNKIDLYFRDSNVIAMTDKLIDYSKSFEENIKQLNSSSKELLRENLDYLDKVKKAIASLDSKIPDTNKFMNEMIRDIGSLNKKIDNISNLTKQEVQAAIKENSRTIESFRTEVESKLTYIRSNIVTRFAQETKAIESSLDRLEKSLENARMETLADIKQFSYQEKDNFNTVNQALNLIEERNKEIYYELDSFKREADKKMKILIGMNIAAILAIAFLLFQ